MNLLVKLFYLSLLLVQISCHGGTPYFLKQGTSNIKDYYTGKKDYDENYIIEINNDDVKILLQAFYSCDYGGIFLGLKIFNKQKNKINIDLEKIKILFPKTKIRTTLSEYGYTSFFNKSIFRKEISFSEGLFGTKNKVLNNYTIESENNKIILLATPICFEFYKKGRYKQLLHDKKHTMILKIHGIKDLKTSKTYNYDVELEYDPGKREKSIFEKIFE